MINVIAKLIVGLDNQLYWQNMLLNYYKARKKYLENDKTISLFHDS